MKIRVGEWEGQFKQKVRRGLEGEIEYRNTHSDERHELWHNTLGVEKRHEPSTAAITTLKSSVSVAFVKLKGIRTSSGGVAYKHWLYINLSFFRSSSLLGQPNKPSPKVVFTLLKITIGAFIVLERNSSHCSHRSKCHLQEMWSEYGIHQSSRGKDPSYLRIRSTNNGLGLVDSL